MAQRVKSRAYDSSRRRAQAAATRRDILEAAQRLFEQQGYAATTIAALWNLLLRGDQGEVPVAERSWYREVLAEPDPQRQLRLNARNSRAVKTRIAGMLKVIRDAAPVDRDIEALWQRIQTEFHANQRVIVERLAERKALRRGLGVDRATDILWTLNHPDVWQLLVAERGWTPEQYEQWFGDTACAQLLGASADH
jgi:hypothetical protein